MNIVVELLTWHKNVQCITWVERGMAAAPCSLFLLCISNLRASEQNPLVLFVTTCIMCVCEKYLLFHLRCQADSIGTLVAFFSKCWKNSGRVVIVMIKKKKGGRGGGDFSSLVSVLQKLLAVICNQYIWRWCFQLKHWGNINNAGCS